MSNINIYLEPNCPITMFILGLALGGGDYIKAAKKIILANELEIENENQSDNLF